MPKTLNPPAAAAFSLLLLLCASLPLPRASYGSASNRARFNSLHQLLFRFQLSRRYLDRLRFHATELRLFWRGRVRSIRQGWRHD